MSRKQIHQAGFTIIELTLAMTFLAFIMVFSATVVVQISNTYFKGLTIKQINQAGRSITDDLSRSLQAASSSDINTSQVDYGLLCVGESAYVWNPVYSGTAYSVAGVSKYKLAGETISLARMPKSLVNDCQSSILPTNSFAATTDSLSLLGGRARVINASATRSQVDDKLVNVKFLIGTFDQTEAAFLQANNLAQVTNSVYHDGAKFTCRPDRLGNFCAFAEFSTTVYVTR